MFREKVGGRRGQSGGSPFLGGAWVCEAIVAGEALPEDLRAAREF